MVGAVFGAGLVVSAGAEAGATAVGTEGEEGTDTGGLLRAAGGSGGGAATNSGRRTAVDATAGGTGTNPVAAAEDEPAREADPDEVREEAEVDSGRPESAGCWNGMNVLSAELGVPDF